MPYTISEGRNQRMTFSSAGSAEDAIAVTWHQTYYVDITGVNPATVSAAEVITAFGIPKVNKTVYRTANGVMPFVICRDKTARQHPERLSRWIVDTKWGTMNSLRGLPGSSEETENQLIPFPAAVADIDPVEVTTFGEMSRVLYWERGQFPLLDPARTPSGNYWSEPVMERIPTRQVKITQYEDPTVATVEELQSRKFTTNRGNYRGFVELAWFIEDVQFVDVSVLTLAGEEETRAVTYTLKLHPFPNETYGGWVDRRALFDTQYLDGGEVKLFQNEQPGTNAIGYIDINGEQRASQTGEPDYIGYENQPSRAFPTSSGGFLQI